VHNVVEYVLSHASRSPSKPPQSQPSRRYYALANLLCMNCVSQMEEDLGLLQEPSLQMKQLLGVYRGSNADEVSIFGHPGLHKMC
jgi:hypothetical protein